MAEHQQKGETYVTEKQIKLDLRGELK